MKEACFGFKILFPRGQEGEGGGEPAVTTLCAGSKPAEVKKRVWHRMARNSYIYAVIYVLALLVFSFQNYGLWVQYIVYRAVNILFFRAIFKICF